MESVKNNKMDKQVKAKFDDFAPPVPPDLWNKIESELDTAQPIKSTPIKRIGLSFGLYGGAIAATLLIAFAFWKFGETETIELKHSPEVYALKAPFEGNESDQEVKNDKKQAQQGGLFEVDPFAAVKNPIKIAEVVTTKPQIIEAKIATEASLENPLKEVESNVVYTESALSLSITEAPLPIQQALPFEGEIIALQEPTPLQEDIQDNVEEEISPSKNKKIGVSTVLNFLAKGLSNENGKSIEFSESEEGILKLDLKLGFAKGNE